MRRIGLFVLTSGSLFACLPDELTLEGLKDGSAEQSYRTISSDGTFCQNGTGATCATPMIDRGVEDPSRPTLLPHCDYVTCSCL